MSKEENEGDFDDAIPSTLNRYQNRTESLNRTENETES